MALSITQLVRYARAAGFSQTDAAIAGAIAMAESSGNPNAHNPNPPDNSYGLWQINMLGSMGPARLREFGLSSNTDLFSPSNNAKAARIIYKQQGWRAWSVYTNGRYQAFLAEAQRAASTAGTDYPDTPTDDSAIAQADKDRYGDRGYHDPSLGVSSDSGAKSATKDMPVKNRGTIDDMMVMGSKVKSNIKDLVLTSEFSGGIGATTELDIKVLDADQKLLKSNVFKKGNAVSYMDFPMVISVVSTSAVSGQPALQVQARAKGVHDLKNRRGEKVMTKKSASEFVIAECKAVGMDYIVQGSTRRTSVSRDVPQEDEKYETEEHPSSWTTFKRLANEEGFIVAECANVLYFCKPTWLIKKTSPVPVKVTYKGRESEAPLNYPKCRSSLDSKKTTVNVELPITRSHQSRVGRCLKLSGVPFYDGNYIISNFNYSLSGKTTALSITAETPIDPEANPPRKPQDASTATGASRFDTLVGGGGFSKPLASLSVTARFGQPGSWAAGRHTGVDYRASTGTPVYAVYDGVTVSPTWGSEYGNHVVLETQFGRWGYCHLSRIAVPVGTQVKSGQLLGYAGNTGRSFGPHLHLELRRSPFAYNNVVHDPTQYFNMTSAVSNSGNGIGVSYSSSASVNRFVDLALQQAGDSYVYGATPSLSNSNPSAFDCSSLVQWCAGKVGVKLPRTSGQQYSAAASRGLLISQSTARRTKGALMYTGNRGATHVAISLGNGKTIEARNPRYGVGVSNFDGRGWSGYSYVPGLKYSNEGVSGGGTPGRKFIAN